MRLPTDYPITQFHTSRPLPIYSLGLQDPALSQAGTDPNLGSQQGL